ncbi:hypothetical protein BKA63DRAFT_512687 [Paraphoma chrysanthemicola]|nr:hypothetical protein BKA63DRAFT_512687 [Paraphoma chrysanthemicola]
MEESEVRKSKTVVLSDSAEIARLRTRTAEETKKLELARKAVNDDTEALRVAARRREIIESQFSSHRRELNRLERDVTEDVELCSARLLKPLLHTLETVLAPELREMVYDFLIDTSEPRMIPEIEGVVPVTPLFIPPPPPPSPPSRPRRRWGRHSPFNNNYIFSASIMGRQISREIKCYYIKKKPLYFRGTPGAERIGLVLCSHMPLPTRKKVSDFVRHLRVYLRCEHHAYHIGSLPHGLPYFESPEERNRRGEKHMFDQYSSRISALRDLPYEKHKIKVEICIFHDNSSSIMSVLEVERNKYNLLEVVKPVYLHAKSHGADIAVRYEDFNGGYGGDVSWELDLEESAPNDEPDYVYSVNDTSSRRTAWRANIDAARTSNPEQIPGPTKSWKHALETSPFYPGCPCESCVKHRANFPGFDLLSNAGLTHCAPGALPFPPPNISWAVGGLDDVEDVSGDS